MMTKLNIKADWSEVQRRMSVFLSPGDTGVAGELLHYEMKHAMQQADSSVLNNTVGHVLWWAMDQVTRQIRNQLDHHS